MTEGYPYKVYRMPELQNSSLLVSWSQDAGKLGPKAIDFLSKKLSLKDFCEIESPGFSSLGGVPIEDNVVQFPEYKFYSCEEKELLIFKGDGPSHEHYKFLNAILDVAQHYCKVKELYTIGGIVSVIAHTSPRRVLAVVNQPHLKKTLAEYEVETNLDYHTPHGGRPTLSSFLSWVAKQRGIAGVNLWGEVPFYLATTDDPRACKRMLTVLDRRFDLRVDFGDLDSMIKKQNEKIAELRGQNTDINKYIEMLERGIMPDEDESEKLAKEVTKFLEKEDTV